MLDIPDEAGNFDSVLVRRAARKLKGARPRDGRVHRISRDCLRASSRCSSYRPPNTPKPDEVGVALDTIFAEYPRFEGRPGAARAGRPTTQKFGAWEVDWVEPQRRTGREPRGASSSPRTRSRPGGTAHSAEVLVSFRPAKDNTHITQLLGRMVRSPPRGASRRRTAERRRLHPARSSTAPPQ